MMLYQMFGRPQNQDLLCVVENSHFRAALANDNTSSAIAVAAYKASGDIGNAIAAASLAQGALHAPLRQARALLDSSNPLVRALGLVAAKERVPGFGNSFYKDRIDPAFAHLFEMLPHPLQRDIETVSKNIGLYPNAAIITAAAAIACNLPAGVEPAIFIHCRVPAWVQLCLKAKSPKVGSP